MGMSCRDFERCTPTEFRWAWVKWNETEERREHGAWERMRYECLCLLQPYSRKRMSVADVMVFPWEREGKDVVCDVVSDEEIKDRYAAARSRYGLR